MNYEDVANKILEFGINTFLERVADIVPNLAHYPEIWDEVPPVARPFITTKSVMRVLHRLKNIIPKIPKYEKYMMVIEMKKILDSLEDEYMHSVMLSKPNLDIAELLQGMGEIHYDGV